MASITKKGKSYSLQIRRKNITIYKTFHDLETAKIYEYYKEKLLDDMEAFDVSFNERISIRHIFELKVKSIEGDSPRILSDFDNVLNKISNFIDVDIYLTSFSCDDWLKLAKDLLYSKVHRGSIHNLRDMSVSTLRRIFAVTSSCFSHAMSLGINIENHPLKVMQTFINPLLKK